MRGTGWIGVVLVAGCGGGGGPALEPVPDPVIPFAGRETLTLERIAAAMSAAELDGTWQPSGHASWDGSALIDVATSDATAPPVRYAGDWHVVHDFDGGWSGSIAALSDEAGRPVEGRIDMAGTDLRQTDNGGPQLAFQLHGAIGAGGTGFLGQGTASVRGDGQWVLGEAYGHVAGTGTATLVLVAHRDG